MKEKNLWNIFNKIGTRYMNVSDLLIDIKAKSKNKAGTITICLPEEFIIDLFSIGMGYEPKYEFHITVSEREKLKKEIKNL